MTTAEEIYSEYCKCCGSAAPPRTENEIREAFAASGLEYNAYNAKGKFFHMLSSGWQAGRDEPVFRSSFFTRSSKHLICQKFDGDWHVCPSLEFPIPIHYATPGAALNAASNWEWHVWGDSGI